MRRFLLTLAILPILAACSSASVTYSVTTNVEEEQRVNLLLLASMRVIERRMANIGEELLDIDLQRNGTSTAIVVQVQEETALDILTEQLTEPFDMQIMKESTEETAEVIVDGHGGFVQTGITGEDILWLESAEEPGGTGRITITFSEEGREKMSTVFQENVGKNIGIFVRGQLVSKLLVEVDELKDDIVITDIPSLELAAVFADDVNVGLHVTFTPTKS
jgi:preprotein translocase subunit SecD